MLQKELGSRVSGCGHRIMAITSAFQADDAGSIPAARSRRADMAQLVERTLGKGEVPSSTLGISTTFKKFYLTAIAQWNHLYPCRTQK